MILITGGLGFIGSQVTRALVDMGESCVVVQRKAGRSADERVHVEQVDVVDTAAFLELGARYPITGIVHLAGAFFGDPLADVRGNVDGLLSVLTAAREWRVGRVGVASTIGVYGDAPGTSPFREDQPLPMTGAHTIQAAKKVFEIVNDFVAGATGLEIVNFRIGAVWGRGGRPDSRFFWVPQLVHAAVRGTELDTSSIYAEDGIDLCYVTDCGRAIALLQLAERLNHRTYNVSAGRPTSHGDIVAALRKAVPEAHFELRPGRNPNGGPDFYLDISRLTKDTGFAPEYDAERGVADYVAWLRAGHER
jgi:UDP-glucose 4-epimerase